MNAAEKAIQLIERFRPHADWTDGKRKIEQQANAKACATICVQEILDLLSAWSEPRDITITREINHYKLILSEIKKNN